MKKSRILFWGRRVDVGWVGVKWVPAKLELGLGLSLGKMFSAQKRQFITF